MNRVCKVFAVLVIAALGVWGCAQGPAQNAGGSDRVKSLEREIAKLQDDYRSVSAIRDQLRKALADKEETRLQLQNDLDQLQASAAKEREELRAQLNARCAERDAAMTQFDQFRKGVRNLLIQADAAAASTGNAPVASVTEPSLSLEQPTN